MAREKGKRKTGVNSRKRDAAAGFTFIEILIYVAVLVAVSALAVQTLLLIHSSLAEIRVRRTLNGTAAVAMERMVRVIRDARSVSIGSSVFNTSPGILEVVGSESPAVSYRFSVTNGTLNLLGGSNPVEPLTPSGVIVTNLVFRMMSASAISSGVKVELTLAAASRRATTTINFYDSILLRNSYAQ